jgi:CLIP-associating protein 1/2
VVEHGTPLKGVEPLDRIKELQSFIVALEQHPVSIRVLQKLALLCIENPVIDPSSPVSSAFSAPSSPSPFSARPIPSLHSDMWTKDKNFERLFNALIKFFDPSRVRNQFNNRENRIIANYRRYFRAKTSLNMA